MRYWIGCHSGNTQSPVGLRPEIVAEGYGWLHRKTLEAVDMGLEPVWHMPFGCAHGSDNPTSCGPHVPAFRDLIEACDNLRSYAVMPCLFVGTRSHDPTRLYVPGDSRWLDPKNFHVDRGVLMDNFMEWAAMGVPTVIFDNSAARMSVFGGIDDFMRDALNMTAEVEGIPFKQDGTIDDRFPSVHMDNIMDRSHPNAVAPIGGNAHICVQWGPNKTKAQVIDTMRRWHARGFIIDFWGNLDGDIVSEWMAL